jgi:uncharacterized protein YqgC (DUF456 family)
MMTVVAIMGWFAFGVAIAVGLALDLVGLFGNWVILGAIGAVWAITGFTHFGGWTMGVLTGLAVLGEVIEAIAAALGAKRFGGDRGAALSALGGAIAGGVVGTPVLPVVGTLIGACAGAFLGAAAHEVLLMRRSAPDAAWTGLGAALGRIAGLVAKLAIGIAMLILAAVMFN